MSWIIRSSSTWLISLSIIFSRFIHAVEKGKISFFLSFLKVWLVFQCVCVCAPHLFLHLSVNGYLCGFYILATLNNAVINIGDHVSFWISVLIFLGKTPRKGIGNFYGRSFLNFWGISILFSIVVVPIDKTNNSKWGFPFLHILTNAYYSLPFDNSHSNMYNNMSLWFDLHFPNN